MPQGSWTPGGREDRFTPRRHREQEQKGVGGLDMVWGGGTGSQVFVIRPKGAYAPRQSGLSQAEEFADHPRAHGRLGTGRRIFSGRPGWSPKEQGAALEYARRTRGGQRGAYDQTRRGQTEEELNRSDPEVYEPVLFEGESEEERERISWDLGPLDTGEGRTPEEERAAWLQAKENVLSREDIALGPKLALQYLVPFTGFPAEEIPESNALWWPKGLANKTVPYYGSIQHSVGGATGKYGTHEDLGEIYLHEAVHASDPTMHESLAEFIDDPLDRRETDAFSETERIIRQEGRYYVPLTQSDEAHRYLEWGMMQPFSIPQELEGFYNIYTKEGKELPEGYKWIKKDGKLVVQGPDGYAPRVRRVTGVGKEGKLEINFGRASSYDLTDKGKQEWNNYEVYMQQYRRLTAKEKKLARARLMKHLQENVARLGYDPYTDEMRPAPTEEETSNALQRISNNLRMWIEFPLAKG